MEADSPSLHAASPVVQTTPSPPAGHENVKVPKDPEKKASSENFVSRIQAGIVALSYAGVLAVAGFIARFAREQFLGVSLGDWTVENLSMLAGRCGIDSLILPLSFLLRNFGWVLGTAIIATLSILLYARFPKRVRITQYLRIAALSILIIAMGEVLFAYEVPVVQLRDYLINAPDITIIDSIQKKEFGIPAYITILTPKSYLRNRYDAINNLLIASRITPSIRDNLIKAKAIDKTFPSQAEALREIEAEYSLTTIVALIAWFYLLGVKQKRGSRGALGVLVFYEDAAFILLLLVTLFIPYMYGKLINSTEFEVVDISYKEAPPQSDTPAVISDEYELISETEKVVTVLNSERGVVRLIQIPRDRLLYLHFFGSTDAMTDMITGEANRVARQ